MKRLIFALAFLAVPRLIAADAALPDLKAGCAVVTSDTSTVYHFVTGHIWRYAVGNPTVTLRIREQLDTPIAPALIPVVLSANGVQVTSADAIVIPAGQREVSVSNLITRYGIGPGGFVVFAIGGSSSTICSKPGSLCNGAISTLDLVTVCTSTVNSVVYTGPITPTCSDDRVRYPGAAPCRTGGN